MGFHNTYRIGLLEKAAQIALKRGVIYRSKFGTFEGPESGVKQAMRDLDEWQLKEARRNRMESNL